MHFLLLGATGRTGRHVVSELLSQGHTATSLIRSPNLDARPGLKIIIGTPTKENIQKAIIGGNIDAAIVTLNTVRASDSPFAVQVSPPRFLADSCKNLCEVLEAAGIRRIIVMSTAGVGGSWNNLPMLSKGFMSLTNIKYALEDHGLVDEEMRLRDMDWTLVRAVRLRFDDKEKDIENLGSDGKGMRMSDSIGVRSVAKYLVKVAVEGLLVKEAVVVRD